ncbi:hypothetical protein LG3211_2240 [Lysobacter gummosus]|nr:hypothetical protein LG3211_2240 [Lysobacter gummosus]
MKDEVRRPDIDRIDLAQHIKIDSAARVLQARSMTTDH